MSTSTLVGDVTDTLPAENFAEPVINSAMRIPELDGLRGIAILMVFLHHAFFNMQTNSVWETRLFVLGRLAWSGVDLFFVLSGFLIGGILIDARNSPRYFKTFYMRRAFRILPLYVLVLTLGTLVCVIPHSPHGQLAYLAQNPISFTEYMTFTQNFWMAFLGTFGVGVGAVTWSLAVEEQFYLTIPLVIRKINNSRLVIFLVSVVIAAPILRILLLVVWPQGRFADYVLMPCRADALSLGVLAALAVRTPVWWKYLQERKSELLLVTGFLFLGMVGLTFASNEFSTPLVTIGYTWIALFYTCCVLIAVTGASETMKSTLRKPWLMKIGTLAYCMYLVHHPLIAAGRMLAHHFMPRSTASQLVGGILALVLSVLIAKISWEFFEKPLLRRGRAYSY